MLGPQRAVLHPCVRLLFFCSLGCAAFCGDDTTRDYTAVPGIRRPTPSSGTIREPSSASTFVSAPAAAPYSLVHRSRSSRKTRSGSTPKVHVRDSAGRQWVAKFGEEAKPDTFGSRMAWALGYYTEINYFVPRGVIRGARASSGAESRSTKAGRFTAARFQLRARSPEYLGGVSWSWDENPFVGHTRSSTD